MNFLDAREHFLNIAKVGLIKILISYLIVYTLNVYTTCCHTNAMPKYVLKLKKFATARIFL